MTYESYEFEFVDIDDQTIDIESRLIRELEVGEKFLMRKTNLRNTSPEMKELKGQWLTVSVIKRIKPDGTRIYGVGECDKVWNWNANQHMDILETNKRIQIIDVRKKSIGKMMPSLPKI